MMPVGLLAALDRAGYGAGPGVAAVRGHADRPVLILETAVGPVVAKRYRGDAATDVATTMQELWSSSFGALRRPPGIPRPLGHLPEVGTVLMEHLDGALLGTRGVLGGTVAARRTVAPLLADLHACGVRPRRVRDTTAVVRSILRKAADLGDAPLARPFSAAAERLAQTRVPAAPLVPNHGDFSPRNVMMTPAGPRLIDFDRFQLASPVRDVAYWGAWIWVTLLLRGRRPSWTLGEEFTAEYLRCAPAAAAEVGAALAFHQAAGLLRIAHDSSALRDRPALARRVVAEAVRRLAKDAR